jgi:hypothetical protein
MIAVKEFGMYTEHGNAAVGQLVLFAITEKLNWPKTYNLLRVLADSDPDQYGEAMDTVVREMVYDALSFDSDFYI